MTFLHVYDGRLIDACACNNKSASAFGPPKKAHLLSFSLTDTPRLASPMKFHYVARAPVYCRCNNNKSGHIVVLQARSSRRYATSSTTDSSACATSSARRRAAASAFARKRMATWPRAPATQSHRPARRPHWMLPNKINFYKRKLKKNKNSVLSFTAER